MKLCPNCHILLVKRFEGNSEIISCSKCGFEKAIKSDDGTKQTRLKL